MKMELISKYMLQVKSFIAGENPPPKGYKPEDKDGGYKSALRLYNIQQSTETTKLASSIIYEKTQNPLALAAPHQFSLL